MYEIILKSVFDLKFGAISGLDVAIFKRFQQAWGTINPNNLNSGIQHCNVKNYVKDICDDIITFSKDRLLEKHPSDDYRKLLELTVIFLSGKLSNNISFKIPRANHHARWMSKTI